jgi:hypothetical protein
MCQRSASVKVVFVPKPGQNSYAEPKACRPISLSPFLLKVMEKLLEKHFRETCLTERPLRLNQHAYKSGRSRESVLRQFVLQIEKSLENQETAPGAFLDIRVGL